MAKIKTIPDEQAFELAELILNKQDLFGTYLPWPPRDYQVEILLDTDVSPNVCVSSARGIGKTKCLEVLILSTCLNPKNKGKQGLVVAPNSQHLNPLFERLVAMIHGHRLFYGMKDRLARSPDYLLTFKNGFILHGRVAVHSKGTSVLGLHCDFLFIEEAQLLYGQMIENLAGCMNPGCKIFVCGFPNGLRKSYLFRAQEDPLYGGRYEKGGHVHVIDKYRDPSFDLDAEERAIKLYGGKNTQAWRNQILADWSIPSQTTFPENDWIKRIRDVEWHPLIINGIEDKNYLDGEEIDFNHFVFPEPLIKNFTRRRVGVDVGFKPDPTIILLFSEKENVWYLDAKVVLREVNFSKQTKIIDYCAKFWEAETVSIDEGTGKPIIQDLLDERLYPERKYKVFPVAFQSSVQTGWDEKLEKPRKARIKYYSTILIQKAFEDGTLYITGDPELIDELQQSTQQKAADGQYTYDGLDHNLDAIRCFIITDYIEAREKQEQKQKSLPSFVMVDF